MLRTFLCLTFLVLFAYTQTVAQLKVLWGEISEEEISLSKCPFDSEAPAVVLHKIGYIGNSYGQLIISDYTRIKILKREGIDMKGDVVISLYTKNEYENLLELKAQTINVEEDGTIVKTEIKAHEIFSVEAENNHLQKKFIFPNVRIGSILEYAFIKSTKNIYNLTDWYFQDDIPILHNELRLDMNADLSYQILYQGPRLMMKYGKEKAYYWTLKNIPAFKPEPFVTNQTDHIEKLKFQLAGYYNEPQYVGNNKFIKKFTDISSKTESMVDYMLEDKDFDNFIGKGKKLKYILDQLPHKSENLLEQVKNIYNYVQKNYKWNGKYGLFPKKTFNEFLSAKNGSGTEINLLIIALLKELNLEVYPCIISTKENGRINKDFMDIGAFNHTLGLIVLDGTDYFCDATDPLRPFDLLAWKDVNGVGLVLDKKKFRWADVKPPVNNTLTFYGNLNF